jgi:hypothetical protein
LLIVSAYRAIELLVNNTHRIAVSTCFLRNILSVSAAQVDDVVMQLQAPQHRRLLVRQCDVFVAC